VLKSKSLKCILDEQLCSVRSISTPPVVPSEKPSTVAGAWTSDREANIADRLVSICEDDGKEMPDARDRGLLRNRIGKAISALRTILG